MMKIIDDDDDDDDDDNDDEKNSVKMCFRRLFGLQSYWNMLVMDNF